MLSILQYVHVFRCFFIQFRTVSSYFVLYLGFTFSFPMIQESIKKGILVTWTKSFACPDGVGDDAVRCLEDALHRRTVWISMVILLSFLNCFYICHLINSPWCINLFCPLGKNVLLNGGVACCIMETIMQ